jgi:hypothetical protein
VTPEKLANQQSEEANSGLGKGTESAMPVQYWPRPNHKEGLLDFFASVEAR